MVTIRIVVNFKYALKGKFYQFFKKSMYLYLAASLLIGYANPLENQGIFISGMIYFLILCSIVFFLYILMAFIMPPIIGFDADVTFTENEIILKHRNKNDIEKRDWTTIKKIDESKTMFYLHVDRHAVAARSGANLFYIPKDKLSKEALELFKEKKKAL